MQHTGAYGNDIQRSNEESALVDGGVLPVQRGHAGRQRDACQALQRQAQRMRERWCSARTVG